MCRIEVLKRLDKECDEFFAVRSYLCIENRFCLRERAVDSIADDGTHRLDVVLLEENRNIHLLEDFGDDSCLFRHFGLNTCGNALDELFAWNRPAVARAEVRKLSRLNIRSPLVGDQYYYIISK